MRYRTPLFASVAAALLLPLGVYAADPAPPAAKADVKAQKKQLADCESSASSRITRDKDGKCLPSSQPTRTFTKQELDSTGETDTAAALRKLDPRFH